MDGSSGRDCNFLDMSNGRRKLQPLQVLKVTQLKELEDKVLSEERKLGHVQSGSQRSQHVVNLGDTMEHHMEMVVKLKVGGGAQTLRNTMRKWPSRLRYGE